MPRTVLAPYVAGFAFVLLASSSLFARAGQSKTDSSSSPSSIIGTWRGTSDCAVAGSPCHDEANVYRFSEVAGKPASFRCTASKIVNEKEIIMGSGDWTYDADRHILESTTANASFRFIVNGNKMEGTLMLPDKTVYRRIHLKKES